MIIYIKEQPIDIVYNIRDKIDELIKKFYFTFNTSVSSSVLIGSESESINSLTLKIRLTYFVPSADYNEKSVEFNVRVYRVFRGKYDELIFDFGNKVDMGIFFVVYALHELNIDYKIFEGSFDETTFSLENFEEEGENIKMKTNVSIDELSSMTIGSVQNILITNRQVPLLMVFTHENNFIVFVIKFNPNMEDVIESIDVVFLSKLVNGKFYIYRDDYNISEYVKSMVKTYTRWNTTLTRFDKLIESL